MKNKKILTMMTIAGLTLGGLSVTAASAQTDVEDSPDAPVTAEAETNEDGTSSERDGERSGERNGRRGHRGGGCSFETAAEAIGIDEAELKAAVESGDSIADVAEANGVDADDVVDAMVDAKSERITEKVEEGRITQDEADEKLAEVEARITDRVNGVDSDDADDDEEAPQS